MARVIEFPRRAASDGAERMTLEQSLDKAATACLELGAKFERIVTDLEKSLSALSVAMCNQPTGARLDNARKIAELKEQLARARSLLEAVRKDLSPKPARH